MKTLTLLIASLFVALVAFAESPSVPTRTTEFPPIRGIHADLKTIGSMTKAQEAPQEKATEE